MTTSAAAALRLAPDGAHLVAGPGCGAPTTLLAAIPETCVGRHWELGSGLLLGDPGFLTAVCDGELAYRTWHVSAAVRPLVASGDVAYVPLRASRVAAALARWGVDVALVRVSPPDDRGRVSLGGSVGYGLDALRLASIRIGEIDSAVPRTTGDSAVPAELFDALVESDTPMPEYSSAEPDSTSSVVAGHVLGLLPRDPVLQIGIGAIPEAVLAGLGRADLGTVCFEGMGSDPLVDLFEQGVLDPHQPEALRSPELMGTPRLMRFADGNPAVGLYPSSSSHDSARLGRRDRLVSVNAAIEIDLTGAVNIEAVGSRTVAGVGGALDFVEGASRSAGGLRVVALGAAARGGTVSRIVPSVARVSVPAAATDVVVTEFGVARLEGLTARERAEALIAVAHPDHRDALADGARPA